MPGASDGQPAAAVELEDWQKKVIDIKATPIPADGNLTPEKWRELFIKGEKQGGLLLRPAPEFRSSAKGFDKAFFEKLRVTHKTRQKVVKRRGAAEGIMQIEMRNDKRTFKAKRFMDMADGPTPFPITSTFNPETEKNVWNLFTSGKCGYRYYADNLDKTMFDGIDKCPGLNLGLFLGNAVRLMPYMAGINTPYSYLGKFCSAFGLHKEDLDLPSINFSHKGWHMGKAKVWYVVPAAFSGAVDELAKSHLPEEFARCGEYIRHKAILIHPRILIEAGIPVYRIVQEEGDFVVTLPGAYHEGFNLGFNMTEAVNFLPYDEVCVKMWLAKALKAKPCKCGKLIGVAKWHPCALVWRMELNAEETGRELYKRLVEDLVREGKVAKSEIKKMDRASPTSVRVLGCTTNDLIVTRCKACGHRFTGLSVAEMEGPGPMRWRTKYLCEECRPAKKDEAAQEDNGEKEGEGEGEEHDDDDLEVEEEELELVDGVQPPGLPPHPNTNTNQPAQLPIAAPALAPPPLAPAPVVDAPPADDNRTPARCEPDDIDVSGIEGAEIAKDAEMAQDVGEHQGEVALEAPAEQEQHEQRDAPVATVAPPPAPVDGQAHVLLQVAEPAIGAGGEELGGGGGAGEGEGEGEEAMGCEVVASASSGAAPAAAAAPLPIQPPSNIGNGAPAPTTGPISFGDLFWGPAPPGIRCRIPGVKDTGSYLRLPWGGVGLAFPPITINPPAASQTARVPPQQEAMATAATATLPSPDDKTRFDAIMALRYPDRAKASAPAPTISGGVASVGLGGAGEALGGGVGEMGRGERQGGGAEREGEGIGVGVGMGMGVGVGGGMAPVIDLEAEEDMPEPPPKRQAGPTTQPHHPPTPTPKHKPVHRPQHQHNHRSSHPSLGALPAIGVSSNPAVGETLNGAARGGPSVGGQVHNSTSHPLPPLSVLQYSTSSAQQYQHQYQSSSSGIWGVQGMGAGVRGGGGVGEKRKRQPLGNGGVDVDGVFVNGVFVHPIPPIRSPLDAPAMLAPPPAPPATQDRPMGSGSVGQPHGGGQGGFMGRHVGWRPARPALIPVIDVG